MEEQKPLSDGWKLAETKKKDKIEKDKTNDNDKKSRFCISFLKGLECSNVKVKGICNFAHSLNDIQLIPCKFQTSCKMVFFDSTTNVYKNKEKNKRCEFIHNKETLDTYLCRIQDVKNAPSNKVEKNLNSNILKDVTVLKQTTKSKPLLNAWQKNQTNEKHVQIKKEGFHKEEVDKKVLDKEEVDKKVLDKEKVDKKVLDKEEGDKWTIVKQKNKGKETKGLIEKKEHKFSKLCSFIFSGNKCPHKVCNFAHRIDQLLIKKCDFDNSILNKHCHHVSKSYVNDTFIYKNITGRKVCTYQHEHENLDNYLKRVQSL
jgi:hypothetical protein